MRFLVKQDNLNSEFNLCSLNTSEISVKELRQPPVRTNRLSNSDHNNIPILHAFLQCDLATPPSRDGVSDFSSRIWLRLVTNRLWWKWHPVTFEERL